MLPDTPDDPLAALIRRLDPVQHELLAEMARAMLRRVEETFDTGSDIATEAFRSAFRNRLLLHHATNEAKLTKKAFEYAFCAATRAAGRQATITSSQTNPGSDVKVDGTDFSLKTEAAAGIHPERITISKLSEGRWIQQCQTTEELAQASVERIPVHLRQYDRILTLRARDLPGERVRYDLVEIPRSVLLAVGSLTVAEFSPRTRQGGSTARVPFGEHPAAFTLRLDGSDGKVTISGLRLDLCVTHCTWVLPTLPEDPAAASPQAGLFDPA